MIAHIVGRLVRNYAIRMLDASSMVQILSVRMQDQRSWFDCRMQGCSRALLRSSTMEQNDLSMLYGCEWEFNLDCFMISIKFNNPYISIQKITNVRFDMTEIKTVTNLHRQYSLKTTETFIQFYFSSTQMCLRISIYICLNLSRTAHFDCLFF